MLAAYLAAGLSLTYYARGRIGARRWRLAHRFIPIAWALAAVHVAGAGTDAVSLWLQVPLALSAALVLALLAERLFGTRRAPRRAVERRRGGRRARAGRPPATPAPAADAERVPVAAPLWSRVDSGSSRR